MEGMLSLHLLLENGSSSIDDALLMIEKYPDALERRNRDGYLPLHIECMRLCRSPIIFKCIELYPDALGKVDGFSHLPFHLMLVNPRSTIEDTLMMMEKCPVAVQSPNRWDNYPIYTECDNQCRSAIISRCIELYPEALSKADGNGYLPLHRLLNNAAASIDSVLTIISIYPSALERMDGDDYLPLHIECMKRCRSSIISKCIQLHPQALSVANTKGSLPLHELLENITSSINDAMMMIENYPAALQHQNRDGYLPLHIECMTQCRSSIISKCIELYPRSLSKVDAKICLPLHRLLMNLSSSTKDALLMIEKYPAALEHRGRRGQLAIHIERNRLCRESIISKCIELYPETFDNDVMVAILEKINKHSFPRYASVLSIMFTARPMSLYNHQPYVRNDIRKVPGCRRTILELLPRRVFTPTHDADYRDLNWQPRAAILMLFSQMKIKQQSR
jgi:ankyrin repeat protein